MMPVEFTGKFISGFARLGRGVLLVNIDRGIGGLLGRDDTWVLPYVKLVGIPRCFSGYLFALVTFSMLHRVSHPA